MSRTRKECRRPLRKYNAYAFVRLCLFSSLVSVSVSFVPEPARRRTTPFSQSSSETATTTRLHQASSSSSSSSDSKKSSSRGKRRAVNRRRPRGPVTKEQPVDDAVVSPTDDDDDDGDVALFHDDGYSPPSRKDFIYPFLLVDHALLTRSQEGVLGRAIQRAASLTPRLRERARTRQDDRAWRAAEQRESQDEWFALMGRGTSQPFVSPEDDEDDELTNLSVMDAGSAWYQEPPSSSSPDVVDSLLRHADDERTRNRSKSITTLSDAEWDLLTEDEVQQLTGMSKMRVESVLMEGSVARDTLVRSNVRLVVNIAKKWCRQQAAAGTPARVAYVGNWNRPSLDEAIQQGILGLITAADRFDPERNLKFGTYATFWITNKVRLCFREASTRGVRVPSNYHETRSKYRTAVRNYHLAGQPVPPIEDIAEEIGVKPQRLLLVLRATRPVLSIDAPLVPRGASDSGRSGDGGGGGGLDEGTTLGERLTDEDVPLPEEWVERSFLRQSLETAMANELAPLERDIVRLRLGLDDGVTRNCRQVADQCGGLLTRNEVQRAEKKAFGKLRSPRSLASYKLLAYLDFAGLDSSTALLD